VNTEAREWQDCIRHELAHVVGFGGHVSSVPSTLIHAGADPGLTAADRLALSILYDSRLRPGMTSAEARPVVAAIIRERAQ